MKKISSLKKTILAVCCAMAFGACSSANIQSDEGLQACLEDRVRLSDALAKIKTFMGTPDRLQAFGDTLFELYMDEEMDAFRPEVITLLAALHDEKYMPAYEHAAKSENPVLVRQAAMAAKDGKITALVKPLIDRYPAADNETKRYIADIGTVIKDPAFSRTLAPVLLKGEPETDTIALLRSCCDALSFQADPTTGAALIRGTFIADGMGRTLSENCLTGLTNIGDPVVPALIKVYSLEDESVNAYVAQHGDRLTPESVRLSISGILRKLQATAALDPIFDFLSDMQLIVPPPALAVLDPYDKNNYGKWMQWASMVSMSYQEAIVAASSIGLSGNPRSKEVLLGIFKWGDAYVKKFHYVIMTGGVNMAEVSMRVNAVKALLENDMINDSDMKVIFETLAAKDFDNEREQRPAIRAQIIVDLVTYLAITSKPGQYESIWTQFEKMKDKELVDRPGFEIFKNARTRIDEVKDTFRLADECAGSQKCYAKHISEKDEDKVYNRIKSIYELGKTKNHDHFATILEDYGSYDVIGRIFAVKALSDLGKASDIAAIDTAEETLKKTKDSTLFSFIKRDFDTLRRVLRKK